MIVLVGDTRSHKNVALLKKLGWGRVRVLNMTKPWEGEPWALDNGAFVAWRGGRPFDGDGFRRRVAKAVAMNPRPFLAVVPDIVAGGLASLALSLEWLPTLPTELPWYLAVQDGMAVADVEPHVEKFAGLFLGGTTEFKKTASAWADLAHRHGRLFHFGRAASIPKIQAALAAGCDSLDSCFPLWTADRLSLFKRLVAGEQLTEAERAVYYKSGKKHPSLNQLSLEIKS